MTFQVTRSSVGDGCRITQIESLVRLRDDLICELSEVVTRLFRSQCQEHVTLGPSDTANSEYYAVAGPLAMDEKFWM